MKIKLEQVQYIPKELESGILYVSKEFGAAAHLCACGCGSKIRTPISPTDWTLDITEDGPSLFPSVGNWQQACQSHYWIYRGKIKWADRWTPEQISVGRLYEQKRDIAYYEKFGQKHQSILKKIYKMLKKISGRK